MACIHPNLKSHRFRDGSEIAMCPDCTKFDGSRRDTLAPDNRTATSVRPSYAYPLETTPELSNKAWLASVQEETLPSEEEVEEPTEESNLLQEQNAA